MAHAAEPSGLHRDQSIPTPKHLQGLWLHDQAAGQLNCKHVTAIDVAVYHNYEHAAASGLQLTRKKEDAEGLKLSAASRMDVRIRAMVSYLHVIHAVHDIVQTPPMIVLSKTGAHCVSARCGKTFTERLASTPE